MGTVEFLKLFHKQKLPVPEEMVTNYQIFPTSCTTQSSKDLQKCIVSNIGSTEQYLNSNLFLFPVTFRDSQWSKCMQWCWQHVGAVVKGEVLVDFYVSCILEKWQLLAVTPENIQRSCSLARQPQETEGEAMLSLKNLVLLFFLL